MTEGEYCVGVTFNPSANPTVDEIKRAAAALIDMIDRIPDPELPDSDDPAVYTPALRQIMQVTRLKGLAQDAVEEAAMWAVKAATKPLPENS